MLKAWISAFRLRTLPLAIASIGLGAFLAAREEQFNLWVFGMTVLTAVLLQILSNLANDYGDSEHGADSHDRVGPPRAVQSGKITPGQMRVAMGVFALLAFGSGLWLILRAIQDPLGFWVFLGLGLLCILAAVTYTSGRLPYGYRGLGDVAVLLFFGWIAVGGAYFLHALAWNPLVLLPASSCGLLATAVLNINNIRDLESDLKAGKITLAARLGRDRAITYHWLLLIVALLCTIAYTLITYRSPYQWLFLLSIPLLWINGRAIQNHVDPASLDPYLKHMALSTCFFVLTLGIGLLL